MVFPKSAGLIAFDSGSFVDDGVMGKTMYETGRNHRKLTQEMRDGMDDASSYAKELGGVFNLQVIDERE